MTANGTMLRRWKTYPAYKDSGIAWLGEIPRHWAVKRAKWITSRIGSGKTPRGGADVYVGDGILFLRSQNVYHDGLRLDDVVYIDSLTDAEMSATRVTPNDVLLNITGASLGRSSLVPPVFPSANVNQHVCIVRPNVDKVQPAYLHNTLTSHLVQSQIFSSENGTSREGLNYSQVANLVLLIPPDTAEQGSISTFLAEKTAKIDALIAKKERLIELLQEKRTALISHAVTKGLNPSVPMKDSGVEWLGKIPAHWEVKRLKYLSHEPLKYGANETGEPYDAAMPRYIRITDIDADGRLRDETALSLTEVRRPRIGGFLAGRFYAATAGAFSAS